MLANYYHDVVLPAMEAVRIPADKLEMLVGKKYWPFPTYWTFCSTYKTAWGLGVRENRVPMRCEKSFRAGRGR